VNDNSECCMGADPHFIKVRNLIARFLSEGE